MIPQEILVSLEIDKYYYQSVFIATKYYKVGHHEINRPIYEYKKIVLLPERKLN